MYNLLTCYLVWRRCFGRNCGFYFILFVCIRSSPPLRVYHCRGSLRLRRPGCLLMTTLDKLAVKYLRHKICARHFPGNIVASNEFVPLGPPTMPPPFCPLFFFFFQVLVEWAALIDAICIIKNIITVKHINRRVYSTRCV